MHKYIIFLLPVLLFTFCKSQPQEVSIEVLEPEFEITSIIILQADLVNTQFEAALKIENPNDFALELSSLVYELYGNGAFWASGKGDNILHVPALSSCETEFRFTMNFINMSRKLLDDVIAMRNVNYRFKGEAEVQADMPRAPSFHMIFENTGFSEVKRKADKKPQPSSASRPSAANREMDNW